MYPKTRDLHPVGNHALKEVWEGNLALRIHALLDSMNVKWTSTDVVRIGDVVDTPNRHPLDRCDARISLWR